MSEEPIIITPEQADEEAHGLLQTLLGRHGLRHWGALLRAATPALREVGLYLATPAGERKAGQGKAIAKRAGTAVEKAVADLLGGEE